MILIFGGTAEGRLALRVADEAGSPFFYSTKEGLQSVESRHATHLSGAMDAAAIAEFCRAEDISLIVDAAHPFAAELHSEAACAARECGIPIVRLERLYPPCENGVRRCDNFEDAIRRLENDGIESLLALTGVKTIAPLRPYWERHRCWFRILRRPSSLEMAADAGFDTANLLFCRAEDFDSEDIAQYIELIRELRPGALLTKESGSTGGFSAKVRAAAETGIPIYAVARPQLPQYDATVTGEVGLRRAIERFVPRFFPLRSGITTGACATAAAKAALLMLEGHGAQKSVAITFPSGEVVDIPVAWVRLCGDGDTPDAGNCDANGVAGSAPGPMRAAKSASAAVIKDAGDDPDITDGVEVIATVRYSESAGIAFKAGEGVGRVTLPGLGLEPGEAAINRVPRQMMRDELTAICNRGLEVEISVPGGAEMALKTFNPKLGIEGGISIIGTTGMVRPFSVEAFVEALSREMDVAVAVGAPIVVLNSGGRSEGFLRARYPDLPPQSFIQYGNYIGAALGAASKLKVPSVVLGVMIGKGVKLAEGHLDTHSRSVLFNREFLVGVAAGAGCSQEAVSAISGIRLAREIWDLLPAGDLSLFLSAIRSRCLGVCRQAYPDGNLELFLIDESGRFYPDML